MRLTLPINSVREMLSNSPILIAIIMCKGNLVLEKLSHLSVLIAVILCGPHERRLINDLMRSYKTLERPVANESDAVVLKFGLTLQQIMDVVSQNLVFKRFS